MKKELGIVYRLQKEISVLCGTASLVGWDRETYMPSGSVEDSAEKSALLGKMIHEKFISKEMIKSVKKLMKKKDKLKSKDRIVVERLDEDLKKALKIPSSLVEEMSKVAGNANPAWAKARKEQNFKIFKPHLEKVVTLKRKEAKLLALPGHPYNSMLDSFEEGMTIDKLKQTFGVLEKDIKKLLQKIMASKEYKLQQKEKLVHGFDAKRLRAVSDMLFDQINLPRDKCRLDTVVHPFTTRIGTSDVRITNRYEEGPFDAISGVIHEGGHALYDLGMPLKYKDTVIFSDPSLGLHESQSRFWENMVGKNRLFWKFFFPKYKAVFKKELKNVTFDKFYKKYNAVKPGFIRVSADELTYCLHIILRFNMEIGVMDGTIKVNDIPKIWNNKFKDMFGFAPRNDSEGMLQDVHWSHGMIGYFPSYALGSIYASQIYKTMMKKNPKFISEMGRGNLKNILIWLNKNIHKYGRSMTTEEIIKKACGEGLNPAIFIDYLNKKYSKIYNL